MPETNTATLSFKSQDTNSLPGVSSVLWSTMSQNDKETILQQLHPIFLTTHTEEKISHEESKFDKCLGFMRLCLEGLLKLIDILVDAFIQIARLAVWVAAISGVLIVVMLMTNTTDKFINLMNESVFRSLGSEARIQKVWTDTSTPTIPATTPPNTAPTTPSTWAQTTPQWANNLWSSALTTNPTDTSTAPSETARERRLRLLQESQNTTPTSTTE